MMLLSVTVNEL